MISVCKIFEFQAAHFLPLYEGNCKNMHGHSYKLEVEVEGVIDSTGMILDFSKLKEIVQEIFLDKIDHSLLNDHFTPPTAEYMVVVMVSLLKDALKQVPDKKLSLRRLRLWETSNSYAEWRQNG